MHKELGLAIRKGLAIRNYFVLGNFCLIASSDCFFKKIIVIEATIIVISREAIVKNYYLNGDVIFYSLTSIYYLINNNELFKFTYIQVWLILLKVADSSKFALEVT